MVAGGWGALSANERAPFYSAAKDKRLQPMGGKTRPQFIESAYKEISKTVRKHSFIFQDNAAVGVLIIMRLT